MDRDDEKRFQALAKRVTLLEDYAEATDDLLTGLIKAAVELGKRTKCSLRGDASTVVFVGLENRLRAMPAGIHDSEIPAIYTAQEAFEDEQAKNLRFIRRNALLELRRLQALRRAEKEKLFVGVGGLS